MKRILNHPDARINQRFKFYFEMSKFDTYRDTSMYTYTNTHVGGVVILKTICKLSRSVQINNKICVNNFSQCERAEGIKAYNSQRPKYLLGTGNIGFENSKRNNSESKYQLQKHLNKNNEALTISGQSNMHIYLTKLHGYFFRFRISSLKHTD